MEPDRGEWPSARWRLTAPESYVLQAALNPSGVEAFKLALRDLVLRRALLVEQLENAGFLRRGPPRTVLPLGTSVTEPALAPLLALHPDARQREGLEGVLVEDFARAARRQFGRSFAGYINDHVYPSLAQRGLVESSEQKRWGVFRRTRHELTPAGREATEELDEWVRVGRERVEGWTRESPRRALAYAGGAGAAILLMPDLYPDFERLGREAATYAEPVLGGGDLDLGLFGGAGDSDAFDSFDAFDGIDAGDDAGAGWGGDGGGGGGDGGGGGNGGG